MEIKATITTILRACVVGVVISIFVFIAVNGALRMNPIFVQSEEKIPAIVKTANPPIVKAGQIWGSEDEGKDPFKKEHIRKHVVAVKKGYVKYYFVGQENYGEWAANSDPDWYFVKYSKLIKDVQR